MKIKLVSGVTIISLLVCAVITLRSLADARQVLNPQSLQGPSLPQITATVPPPKGPLNFQLSLQPKQADIGDVIIATILLDNPTVTTATHVVITHSLPYGTVYEPSANSPTPVYTNTFAVWMLPDLPPQGHITLTLAMRIIARNPKDPYTLSSYAVYQALPFSPNTDGNPDWMRGRLYWSQDAIAYTSYLDPHWIVRQRAESYESGFVCPGQIVTYHIGIGFLNAYSYWPEWISSLTVTDTFPSGAQIITPSINPTQSMMLTDNQITWQSLYTWEATEPPLTVTFAVRLPAIGAQATLTNTIEISNNPQSYFSFNILTRTSNSLTGDPIVMPQPASGSSCANRTALPIMMR